MAFDLDEKYIVETENKLGVRLPESYRNVMMLSNGGLVSDQPPSYFDSEDFDEDEWYLLAQLYPILDKSDRKRQARSCNDIILENNKLKNEYDLPKDYLYIADFNGELYLCFALNDEGINKEVICYDYHEQAFEKIADDFSELSVYSNCYWLE